MEKDRMARLDPDRHMWIWEGQFRRASNEQVFHGKWRMADFEPARDWEGPYFGADFGFSQDPSTLVKLWIHDNRLWVSHEAYKVGVELDHMPAFYDLVPESRDYKIRADCARPETISYLARHGFSIEGAEKWPGSIEDGITHMRGFEEIIVHNRCQMVARDFARYSFKVDRNTGEILTVPVDKWNDTIDAIRYGIQPMIKKGGVIGLWERIGNG
jgi:phage terminase large subunit